MEREFIILEVIINGCVQYNHIQSKFWITLNSVRKILNDVDFIKEVEKDLFGGTYYKIDNPSNTLEENKKYKSDFDDKVSKWSKLIENKTAYIV